MNNEALNFKDNPDNINLFRERENIDSHSSKNIKNIDKNNNNYMYNNYNNQSLTQNSHMSNNLNLISPFTDIRPYNIKNNEYKMNIESYGNNNINSINEKNIKKTLPIKLYQSSDIMNNNNFQTQTNINQKIINNTKNTDVNSNNNINNNTISQAQNQMNISNQNQIPNNNSNNININLAAVLAQQIQDPKIYLDNNNDKYKEFMKTNTNFRTIYEEPGESESELKSRNTEIRSISLQYYLNKPFILCPVIGTNKLKIITDNEEDENFITISFPKNLGINIFLKDLSYCNYDKKLYISGGILDENNQVISDKLFVIDLFQNTLEGNNSIMAELQPMNYPRNQHSMIGYEDYIYVVGGVNSNTVERYDIKNNSWEELNPMTRIRSYPNIFIYEGFLYAFFGKENEIKYDNTIERLFIEDNNINEWELLLFQNPNDVNLNIIGCGLYPVDELIYFFGGKCMGQNTDEIFFINLKERIIDRTDAKLEWKDCFRENTLFQLGKKLVQISEDKYFGYYLKVEIE